jgi:hypothetical protein
VVVGGTVVWLVTSVVGGVVVSGVVVGGVVVSGVVVGGVVVSGVVVGGVVVSGVVVGGVVVSGVVVGGVVVSGVVVGGVVVAGVVVGVVVVVLGFEHGCTTSVTVRTWFCAAGFGHEAVTVSVIVPVVFGSPVYPVVVPLGATVGE